MTPSSSSPLDRFIEKVSDFAQGRSGIRNPFVIVPVDPSQENEVTKRLRREADEGLGGDATVQTVDLESALSKTDVFDICVEISGSDSVDHTDIENTMKDRLSEEIVEEIMKEIDETDEQSHVVLLLNLGSLYPFTRASKILDELDRRGVKSTIGIPFPGDVVGGNLTFFGEESRSYYPAHQIDGRIEEEHLQT